MADTIPNLDESIIKDGLLPAFKLGFLNIDAEIVDNGLLLEAKSKELTGAPTLTHIITTPDQKNIKVKSIDAEVVDGFYSPLQLQVRQMKQDKFSAKQWNEKLAGEEARWSGLTTWLEQKNKDALLFEGKTEIKKYPDGRFILRWKEGAAISEYFDSEKKAQDFQKGMISKDEILSFIQENRIVINEVVKEFIPFDPNSLELNKAEKIADIKSKFQQHGFEIDMEYGDLLVCKDGELIDYEADLSPELQQAGMQYYVLVNPLNSSEAGIDNPPQYAKYQLQGEKFHEKEVLVTLPYDGLPYIENKVRSVWKDKYGDWQVQTEDKVKWKIDGATSEQEALELYNQRIQLGQYARAENIKNRELFHSPHYNEKNILAHIRMNVRKDENGRRILFIEELQSDWAQKGKREGFKFPFHKSTSALVPKYDGKYWYNHIRKTGELYSSGSFISEDEAWKFIKTETELFQKGVPAAPFVTETSLWTKLALKVALKHAVLHKADYLSWTTGEQQNKRYDLSNQIDLISTNRYPDNTYTILCYKDSVCVLEKNNIPQENLGDFVSKEVAERIIKRHNETAIDPDKWLGSIDKFHEFEKLLCEQYSNTNPNSLKKYLLSHSCTEPEVAKKYFEMQSAAEMERRAILQSRNEAWQEFSGIDLSIGGQGMKGFYGSSDSKQIGIIGSVAKGLLRKLEGKDVSHESITLNGKESINGNEPAPTFNQHAIPISENMREQILQGLPLFRFDDQGNKLGFTHRGKIYLDGQRLTAKTTLEEAGHVWVNWAKQNRTDLHKSGLEKVEGSIYLREVETNPHYQAEAKKVDTEGTYNYRLYMKEEALAKAIGDQGERLLTERKKRDFKSWMKELWNGISKVLSIRSLDAEAIAKLSLKEFSTMVVADLLNNKSKDIKPSRVLDEFEDVVFPDKDFKRFQIIK